ncbi:MAG: hypothetical protein LBS37_06160 [Treponema sp.]|nr:hypothetical protein [Treponema sp.]
MAGGYENGSTYTACYWKNEIKYDLAVAGYDSEAFSIGVFGGDVFAAGYYEGNSGDGTGTVCYWKNGARTGLPVPAAAIFGRASAIVVVE